MLKELEGPALSAPVGGELGVALRDKPRMITICKWHARKDGRIHVDRAAKIVTALRYLNESWPAGDDGGTFARAAQQ